MSSRRGESGRLSQGDGLLEHAGAQMREKAPFCYDVYLPPEKPLQINLEVAVVDERPAAFQVDQEVDVTIWAGFATCR